MEINLLSYTYYVRGLNLNDLLAKLIKKKVSVYEVKRLSINEMTLELSPKDKKTFLRVSRNQYKVKLIRKNGVGACIFRLLQNVGACLGVLVFFLTYLLFNKVVLSYEFQGDGEKYEKEITAILKEEGVKINSISSKKNYDEIEREIVLKVKGVNFATVEKKGNKIVVFVKGEKESGSVIDKPVKQIKSDYSGKVLKLIVLSGTAQVAVGDEVEAGQVLIDGFYIKNEERIESYSLGYAIIEVQKEFYFLTDKEDDFYYKEISRASLDGKDITSIESERVDEKEYNLLVKVKHLEYVNYNFDKSKEM